MAISGPSVAAIGDLIVVRCVNKRDVIFTIWIKLKAVIRTGR